jgi:hypothetical protein
MPPSLTRVFDNLYATTIEIRMKELQNVLYERNPLWMHLKAGGSTQQQNGGAFIQHPLQYAENNSVTSIGKAGTVALSDPEFLTNDKWDWKYITGHIIRDFTEEQKNSGTAAKLNLVAAKFENLKDSYADYMEEKAFADGTGNGGLDIGGLALIVADDPTTGTVANINRATNSWWRNQTTNMTAISVSTGLLGEMETMFNDCGKLSGGARRFPDMITTTQSIYETYKAEAPEISRIQLSKDGPYGKLVDLGFGDVAFRGVPVMWSHKAPAGKMYFTNSSVLKFTVDGNADFALGDWIAIPNQPTRKVAHSLVAGNLTCSNCAKNGVLFNIGDTA